MIPHRPLAAFLLAMAVVPTGRAQVSNGLTAERWNNLPGSGSVRVLEAEGIARRAPDQSTTIPAAQWGPNVGDNYGLRLRGSVVPPVTGDYTFFIAGDDGAELWLSPDATRTGKRRVAWNHVWVNPNQWNARDTQRSAVLRLTAGQPYALDALLQEIGGGDHLSLGWAYEEPVALQSTAIGSPVTQDWTTTADGKIQVTVEAGDITATADRFGFHQRAWTGDGEIIARVETMNNPYGWAKVGVMLRAGLEPDAAHAMIVRTPANGMAFQRRKTSGAGTANTNGGPIREWIKLTRKDETITASTSADGEYWEAFGSDTFPGLPVSVLVGLAASDITAATTSPVTATISHWSVQPLVAAEGIPSTALIPLQADPADMDADDLPDAWESTHDLDPAIAIGVHGPYGDPDMDGIANLREYQLGSDPRAAEAVGGGLSRERWEGIGGTRVADLTGNRARFLRQPDDRTHTTEIREVNRGDNYGSRFVGTLTAPATGDYTFWIAGDDEAELWIAAGGIANPLDGRTTMLRDRFGKQRVAWVKDSRFDLNYTASGDFDRFATQRTRTLHLVAGQTYFLEVLHKEGGGGDHLALAWQPPGGTRGPIPASMLATEIPEPADVDNDCLPDLWESGTGLNPADNGLTDARDGQRGDWDADGLDNLAEFQLGTNPKLADTDGDGLSDRDERDYYRSNPLANNQLANAVHTTWDLAALATAGSGWDQRANGAIAATARRGWLDCPFTIAAGSDGVHEIHFTGGASGNPRPSDALPLEFSIDGASIGRATLVFSGTGSATVKHLTPWLAAGDHVLRVTIPNIRADISPRIDALELHHLGGIDLDANNIPDWVEHQLAAENHIDRAPPASPVSPACVEAITANPAGMTITRVATGPDGQPVEQLVDVLTGINGGVFADVPLDPAGPVDIRFQFQQGAVAETRAITWSATNILNGGQLSLRAGDALRLTAHDPALPAAGTFTLTDTLAPASRPPLPGTITSHLPVTPATAPVAWPDQDLTLLAAATGTLQGAWIPAATPAVACHIASDGSSATMQLQFFDGTYTKVAKIRIDKTPAGLTAHQIYAKYKSGNALGQNFDSIPSTAAPAGSTGYGVTAVTLTFLHGQAGTTTLTPAGGTPSADPLAVTFTTPGIHTLAATWTPADGGQASTATLVVTAHAASFGAPLDVLTFNRQAWKLPGIAPDLTVEADAALAWNETTMPGQLPRTFTVDTYQTGPRHVLARIPGSNAIAARGTVNGFDIGFADRTDDAAIADILPDGSRVFRFTLTCDGLPAGFSIKLSTYYQGATFADGGREKILTAADFDANGIATVEVFWGPDGEPRICHRATVTGPGGQVFSSENKELYNPQPKNFIVIITDKKLRDNDNHDNGGDVWDKKVAPVNGVEEDLRQVTLLAINNRDEPAYALFELIHPGNLSPKYWKDGKKQQEASVIWSKTLEPDEKWRQDFFVEGIHPSGEPNDVKWKGDIVYGTPHRLDATVYQIDMDVDSDNTGTIDGTEDEDQIEESTSLQQPGKYVVTAIGSDSDGDGTPDFADGLGLAAKFASMGANSGMHGSGGNLVPVIMTLSKPLKADNAKVRFTYEASSPSGIIVEGAGTPEDPRRYRLAKSGMRLWTVDAPDRPADVKTGHDVAENQPGNKFIPSGTEIPWKALVAAAGATTGARELTLYLEYVEDMGTLKGSTKTLAGQHKTIFVEETTEASQLADDEVHVTLVPMNLEIYKPKVVDASEAIIKDDEELTRGSVTFVNIDNDDGDSKFDNGGAEPDDEVAGGDDELVMVKLKVWPSDLVQGQVNLVATQGAEDISVWTSANKAAASAYTLGSAHGVVDLADEEGCRVKKLWIEGIRPHSIQQGTKFKMDFTIGKQTCQDQAALTVVGVEGIKWEGKGNSLTNGDVLDADKMWPEGLSPAAVRVFPDSRVEKGAVEAAPRDKVMAEIKLSVAPPMELKIYLDSYDVDDPTSAALPVDDDGLAWDNRGTPGDGMFTGEADGILALVFPENENTRKCEFQVSMQPGDNFRLVANGDKDFLAQLVNKEPDQNNSNEDKQRICNKDVVGTPAEREVRQKDKYASDVLTVWRFLHVEVDSMGAHPQAGAESNIVRGNVTSIKDDGTKVGLNIDLTTGLGEDDFSRNLDSNTQGNGRFEGGSIRIGVGPAAMLAENLPGNGNNFVSMAAEVKISVTITAPEQPVVKGIISTWSNKIFDLAITDGTLSAEYVGGTLNFLGVETKITAVSFVGASKFVTVEVAPIIPFELHDDDFAQHPFVVNTSLMQASDSVEENLFAAAYVRPVYDLAPGKTAPFQRNVEDNESSAQLDAGRDSVSSAQFWTVYVQAGFQGNILEDMDPMIEGGHWGQTPKQSSTGSMVYVETIRDEENSRGIATGAILAKTTVHEVVHQFGIGAHDDVSIMKKGYPAPLLFLPIHLHIIRKIPNP